MVPMQWLIDVIRFGAGMQIGFVLSPYFRVFEGAAMMRSLDAINVKNGMVHASSSFDDDEE